MCVAALIETEAGPTKEELRLMHVDNPHGAGVAWAEGNRIVYHKSVRWEWIAKNQHKFPRPYLLHFRWATHGGRGRHLSHPFPLSVKAITSKKLSGTAESVLIHNGVWTNYTAFLPSWLSKAEIENLSDTAVAAYAARVYGEDVLDDVDWATAVGKAVGNGRMDVTLRGRWMEHQGNLYSNLGWQKTNWSFYSPSPWRGEESAGTVSKMTDNAREKSWQEFAASRGGYDGWEWTDDGRLVRISSNSIINQRTTQCALPLEDEPTPLNPDVPLWLPKEDPLAEAMAEDEFLHEYAPHVIPKVQE